MKTVSELAVLIQQGREELLPNLWEAVRGLVAWFAKQFYFARENLCLQRGIELDDLIQEGYFAMLDTVRKYDPDKGAFSTMFLWDIRHHFYDALGRTRRQRSDPLNNSISLDAELDPDDPESDSLFDTISDGCDYAGNVEHKLYLQQLHNELERVLSTIPDHEADVIRALFYDSKTLKAIAEKKSMSIENVRQLEAKGFRQLRKPQNKRALEQYLDSYTNFYSSVSVDRFNATHTSSVEALVLFRDRKRGEYNRSICE